MSGFGSAIDEICPSYVGEDRIVLELAPDQSPKAFSPVSLTIDYSSCDEDGGAVGPFEIFVRAPSVGNCRTQIIESATPPTSIQFTPREGGPHMLLIREAFHNQWWGRLRVQVAGEKLRMASAL